MTQTSTAKAILRNYHALQQRRYVGDMDACDTLVDFDRAVKRARLTARQSEAIRLVYVEDLTQKVAGERMGVDRITLKEHADTAVEAIESIYETWAWVSGDLTSEDFMEAEAIA